MGVKNFNVLPWVWASADEIRGKIAIDMPNYMTRRMSVIEKTRKRKEGVPLGHLRIGLGLITMTLRTGILPVMIFDGPPETLKRAPNPDLIRTAHDLYLSFQRSGDRLDIDVSSNLTQSPALRMYFALEHVRDLAGAVGIPTCTAPSEAEMLAAALCRESLVRTVVSTDADALLFGSPHMTGQMLLSRGRVFRATLGDLETTLGLRLDQIRDLAVMCGCDFHNEGLRGVGPRRGAVLLKRHGNLDSVLRAHGCGPIEREQFMRAREIFDEVCRISLRGVDLTIRPPIASRIIDTLIPAIGSDQSQSVAERTVKAWREFRNVQSTLEQWV
ncbi:MAG: hypothetical protein C4K49_04875 [Candidatus Thorarchaeota archaeon]|nr:MAG: hypothetical protein C4K49_04875 [Candidatus Thorarchaeota archaeon]